MKTSRRSRLSRKKAWLRFCINRRNPTSSLTELVTPMLCIICSNVYELNSQSYPYICISRIFLECQERIIKAAYRWIPPSSSDSQIYLVLPSFPFTKSIFWLSSQFNHFSCSISFCSGFRTRSNGPRDQTINHRLAYERLKTSDITMAHYDVHHVDDLFWFYNYSKLLLNNYTFGAYSREDQVSRVLDLAFKGSVLIIYAPPCSGKTTFLTDCPCYLKIFDTDEISTWSEMPSIVITNMPHVLKYGYSIKIVPSYDVFYERCLQRNLSVEQKWYTDLLSIEADITIFDDGFVNQILSVRNDCLVIISPSVQEKWNLLSDRIAGVWDTDGQNDLSQRDLE